MARSIYGVGQREPEFSDRGDTASAHFKDDEVRPEIAWRVELLESQACWYDLVFNPPVPAKAVQVVAESVTTLYEKAANAPVDIAGQSSLCLFGFWAARTKVRFCMSKSPYFALIGDEFIFYVELGADRVRKKLATTFVDVHTGWPVKPQIELDERFITISLPDEEPETVSIYDFLRKCGLELGISTNIYATQYLNAGQYRWQEAVDRNLTEMLYQVSNESCDFFFFCNLFKVTLVHLDAQSSQEIDALRPAWPLEINNSQSVSASAAYYGHAYRYTQDERGRLIERALSAYFQLPSHVLSLPGEIPFNDMNGQIFSIQVLLDIENPHEIYRFGSFDVPAADKHMFTCRIMNGEAELAVLE